MSNNKDLSQQAVSLRKQAEKIFQERSALISNIQRDLPPNENQRILHELQVHQIELEMQNEELRRAQAELGIVKERYFDLYNLAPVGYVTLNEQGLILEANLTASALLDVTRDTLIKKPLSHFIVKEDQDIYYRHRKKLTLIGEQHTCSLRILKNDGVSFWATLATTLVPGEIGHPECRVVISDITGLKTTELELKASLKEKEVLLKEVHHRVKNNLAVIMGLIDMQVQTMDREPDKSAIMELNARVRSMALVHERLYTSKNFSRINFQDYLEDLVSHLRVSFELHEGIRVCVAAAGVYMDLSSAVPCGLFITELVTNAFKHAFPPGWARSDSRCNTITVSTGWDGSAYTITVADNGVGLPAGVDWATTKSMGLMLIRMLGRHQLQGALNLDRCNGTSFRLQFVPTDTMAD